MDKTVSHQATVYTRAYDLWIKAEWSPSGFLNRLTPLWTIPEQPFLNAVSQKWVDELLTNLELVRYGKTPALNVVPPKSLFDENVRNALWKVTPGNPVTYGTLAKHVNRPGGAQAVGQACARNPLALLVPCHRITAAKGSGGYRWGLPLKYKLLEIEAGRVNRDGHFQHPAVAPVHPMLISGG